MIASKTTAKIGPKHHGRKVSLKAFEFAEVEEGHLYELARGYIVVSEVPNYAHALQVALIRAQLILYQAQHPELIHVILGAMECKLLIAQWDSERHPDLAVYLTTPKGRKDRTLSRTWIPDLAIEVVSESSRDRDYTEKRDEYWTLGVKEYWIMDAKLNQVLILRRGRSQWTEKTLGPANACETKLLPAFSLSCREIFETAAQGKDAEV
jgi:Uma2 family endonuclease